MASTLGLTLAALLALPAPGAVAASPAPAPSTPAEAASSALPALPLGQTGEPASGSPVALPETTAPPLATLVPGGLSAPAGSVVPAATLPEAVRASAGPPSTGAVALTFDDGYARGRCAAIAHTLREAGATGTFFINGNHLKASPDAWRRILAGQAVGNHTRSHRDLTRESDLVARKQIAYNETLHERILGVPMLKVLRPPYGAQDARVRRIAGALGYSHTVLWSVDSGDWKRSATVRSIVRRATGAPPGSIILMHCGPAETPTALPRIVRHYQRRGIRLAGLDVVLELGEEPATTHPDGSGTTSDDEAEPTLAPLA